MGSNRHSRRRHAPPTPREGRTGQQARPASQVGAENFIAPATMGETRQRPSCVSVPLRRPPSCRSAHHMAASGQGIGPQRQDYAAHFPTNASDLANAGRRQHLGSCRALGHESENAHHGLCTAQPRFSKERSRSVILCRYCATNAKSGLFVDSFVTRCLPRDKPACQEVCYLSALIATENREHRKNMVGFLCRI